ncbi:MAG: hypothetical protein U0176_14150 [Bacteroidia bacterium]
MEKFALAFFYNGRYILAPMVRTDQKALLESGDCVEIFESGPGSRSGSVMIQTLNAFRMGTPHPDLRNLKESETPILRFLGLKKYSHLMKSAKVVELRLENGFVNFLPMKNEGKGGYTDILESEFAVEATSVDRLFQSLKDAFDRCR